jgi:3-deoxy-D-manno-octulosonic-acid transferase
MQTLYAIHTNNVGQVSVDTFNDRRQAPNKWRVFFCVTPSSVMRLRRVYAKHKKRFYISFEWSPSRWRVYREWRADMATMGKRQVVSPSLVPLQTNSKHGVE